MSRNGVRVQGFRTSATVLAWAIGAICVAAVALAISAPGCESLSAWQERAQVATTQAEVSLAEKSQYWADEFARAVKDGDRERADFAAQQLSDVHSAASELESAKKKAETYLDESGNIDQNKVLTESAALLPFPFNVIVMVGAPLVVGGVQEWRQRRAVKAQNAIAEKYNRMFKETVGSIDSARKENPLLADLMAQEATKTALWEPLSTDTYEAINSLRNT